MRKKKESGHSLSAYQPLVFQVGILTCSSRYAKKRGDESGDVIFRLLHLAGNDTSRRFHVVKRRIVPDNLKLIVQTLKRWCDREKLDLILTTGGTGFSPTDITPEATRAVIEREAPGLSEAMRIFSNQMFRVGASFLSRGICGIRKKTIILNLPGSPAGAKESLEVVLPLLPHALELLAAIGGHEALDRKSRSRAP